MNLMPEELQHQLAQAIFDEYTGNPQEAERLLITLREQYPHQPEPHTLLGELYLKYGHKIPAAREIELSIKKGNDDIHSLEQMIDLSKELDGWKGMTGHYENLLQQAQDRQEAILAKNKKAIDEYFSINPSTLPPDRIAPHWLRREEMLSHLQNHQIASRQITEAIKTIEQRTLWSGSVDLNNMPFNAREIYRHAAPEALEGIINSIYHNAKENLRNGRTESAIYDIYLAACFREPQNDDERAALIDVATHAGTIKRRSDQFIRSISEKATIAALTEQEDKHTKTGLYIQYLLDPERMTQIVKEENNYEINLTINDRSMSVKNFRAAFHEYFDPDQFAKAALIVGDVEKARNIYRTLLSEGRINDESLRQFSSIMNREDFLNYQPEFKKLFENSHDDIWNHSILSSLFHKNPENHQMVNESMLQAIKLNPESEINQKNMIVLYGNRDEKTKEKEYIDILLNNPFLKRTDVALAYCSQYETLENPETLIQVGQAIQEIAPHEAKGHVLQAKAYIDREDFLQAEEQLQHILEHKDLFDFFKLRSHYYSKKGDSLGIIENYFAAAAENVILYSNPLGRAFKALKGAQNAIREIKERGNLASGVLQEVLVTLLDYTHQEKESVEATKDLCSYLLKEKESHDAILSGQALEPVGFISKNDVVTLNNSALSSNIYIIKRRNHHLNESAEDARKRLEQEYAVNTFIANAIDDDELRAKIAAPIALFSERGEIFFFQKKIGGKQRLEELLGSLKPEEKEKQLIMALDTIGDIQNAVMPHLLRNGPAFTISDGQDNYHIDLKTADRIEDIKRKLFIGRPTDARPRLGNSQYAADFLREYRRFVDQDRKNEEGPLLFVHNEFFPMNVLQDGHPIDFERAGVEPTIKGFWRDFYGIMENEQTQNINIERARAHYFKKLAHITGQGRLLGRILEEEKSERSYHHLRRTAIALQQDKPEQATYHVRSLIEQFDGRLLDSFVRCIQASDYEYLNHAIK